MKHKNPRPHTNLPQEKGRRNFAKLAVAALAGTGLTKPGTSLHAAVPGGYISGLREKPITIDMLVFDGMDQIDFTGPFSVLVRLPNAQVKVVGLTTKPVRDHKGLVLTPEMALGDVGRPDVLVVPGGPGQEALMDHGALLDCIAEQAKERAIFSVCTGALLCGAAGVLRGRRATTHWSSFALLPHFSALPVRKRVVVDGDLITAAGVTAGIDGALHLASLLRGPQIAQQIQLDIQYAPEPPFNAGSPETAPPEVLEAVTARFRPLTEKRTATAKRLEEAQHR